MNGEEVWCWKTNTWMSTRVVSPGEEGMFPSDIVKGESTGGHNFFFHIAK